MCSNIKSENINPFRFSIALKKKGRLIRIPVKIAIPTQNFHLNEGIFHASDHFKLKAEGVKLKALSAGSFSVEILYINSDSFKHYYLFKS
jgi:hypothetical protein